VDPNAAIYNLYTVKQVDAHAWPEVYFPGYGWIEFEPTASQSALTRTASGPTNQPTPTISPTQAAQQQQLNQFIANEKKADAAKAAQAAAVRDALTLGAIIIILIASIGVALFIRRRSQTLNLPPLPVQLEKGLRRIGIRVPRFLQMWARYASLSPLSRAYLEINRALRLLGKPPAPHDTPAERSAALVELVPAVSEQTQYLLKEYQLSIYSRSPSDGAEARLAGSQIRARSYRALLERWLAKIQEPVSKNHR
jgi:hypothetical protein